MEVTLWHTMQPMADVRLQSHEATSGELLDYSFETIPGDRDTWYTRMRIRLSGDALHSRHQMTLAAYDAGGRPVEVVTVIAAPKEE